MIPLADCRLYTFVDTTYLCGQEPDVVAQKLCDGGSDLIQLRAKTSTVEEIRRMAEAILPVTQRAGVGLIINDHPQLAVDVGADVVHLGQEDFFDAGYNHAGQIVGPSRQIKLGLSTHSPEQAQRALRADADYLAIGPVYATRTKPTRPAVTWDYLRWAAASVEIPWFAIGGITIENLDEVLAAGASRICVVSAILTASDISATCRQFKKRVAR